MAKITKKGTIKMTSDELFDLCHRFYYEGVGDESKNCACDAGVKQEFERLTSEIVENGS